MADDIGNIYTKGEIFVSIQHVLSSSFLDNVNNISILDMGLSMGLAFLLGLWIFFIYRQTYKGVMYSSSFGVALVAITLITTLAILAVTSNIVLSLGMVGALSIVRFRAAIKEPLDIAYLFWSLAAGIVLAAGMLPLAVFGSLFIGAILYAFGRMKPASDPFILVLHCDSPEAESQARAFVAGQVKRLVMKSKSVRPGIIELNYEVRLKNEDTAFINLLGELPGVSNVTLVSYNGDYMG